MIEESGKNFNNLKFELLTLEPNISTSYHHVKALLGKCLGMESLIFEILVNFFSTSEVLCLFLGHIKSCNKIINTFKGALLPLVIRHE